jgi:hypothetical protein
MVDREKSSCFRVCQVARIQVPPWFDRKFATQGWFTCNVMLIEWNENRKWVATGVLYGDVWDTRLEVLSKLISLA